MNLIEEIIKTAKDKVDEVELLYSEGHGISADLKKTHINTGTVSRSSGIIIRTVNAGKIGVSATDSVEKWRECLDAAIAGGQLSDAQKWNGLPEPCEIDESPLAFDKNLSVSVDTLNDLIDQMLKAAEQHDVQVTGGSASVSTGRNTIANSNGLHYSVPSTGAGISLECISGQSTGYEFDSSYRLDDIDASYVGEHAAWFAETGSKGTEISTGIYDIILSPVALSQLLGNTVVPALSGRNVNAGRSRFAGMIGEQVIGDNITMTDDPFDKRGTKNCAWDAEGMPTKKIDFIENGVLKAFAYDLKTAYRCGTGSTANAVRQGFGGAPSIGHHNLLIKGPKTKVLDEKAVYIHDVVGAHTANPMSGDFSVELSNSYMVENGELTKPVRSAMLSGNVFEMLKLVEGVSEETRTLGSMILPSIRISGQSLVGKK